MKHINRKHSFILGIIMVFCLNINNAFAQNTTLNQDEKFEQLLNEKRKINASINANSLYKIQIFNGTSEESKNTLIQFRRENKNYDATIIFSTPAYKVIVGYFKSRIEAERNLKILKKNYPNALIIKPSK